MPTPPQAVAHLLRRSGFGGTPAQVAALTPLDITEIVERVLDTSKARPLPTPSIVTDDEADHWERYVAMVQAWFERMRVAPAPIVEKMTLFWHGHFTSSLDKVGSHTTLWQQNQLLRAKGLGSFVELTKAVALDPAMLRYLDNDRNRRGAPNENFARELMELMTLGVNQYTQQDVAEAARAWTGHTYDRETGRYAFVPDRHDAGQKTIFGVTRAWTGPQLVDEILLGRKREVAARFLATKIWSFLAYPDPEPAVVDAIVKPYLATKDLQLEALLRAIFLRPEFYSVKARQGLVRSPIEYVVAAMRATNLPASVVHPEWWLEGMGQQPFYPPNVSGWRPNGYWISASAQWARSQFAGFVRWKGNDAKLDHGTVGMGPDAAVRHALRRFGVDHPSRTTVAAMSSWLAAERGTSRWAEQPNLTMLCLLTPEFQLA
jgi:uncharacterized protein (DUF1800 family)